MRLDHVMGLEIQRRYSTLHEGTSPQPMPRAISASIYMDLILCSYLMLWTPLLLQVQPERYHSSKGVH